MHATRLLADLEHVAIGPRTRTRKFWLGHLGHGVEVGEEAAWRGGVALGSGAIVRREPVRAVPHVEQVGELDEQRIGQPSPLRGAPDCGGCVGVGHRAVAAFGPPPAPWSIRSEGRFCSKWGDRWR